MSYTVTKEQIQALKGKADRWVVDTNGNVFDSNFEHDARLMIDGDFKSNIQRQVFGQMIADALNKSLT